MRPLKSYRTRKLLQATAGLAAVTYFGSTGCSLTSGNLVAPVDLGASGGSGTGGSGTGGASSGGGGSGGQPPLSGGAPGSGGMGGCEGGAAGEGGEGGSACTEA